jgi:hypothetical protein
MDSKTKYVIQNNVKLGVLEKIDIAVSVLSYKTRLNELDIGNGYLFIKKIFFNIC